MMPDGATTAPAMTPAMTPAAGNLEDERPSPPWLWLLLGLVIGIAAYARLARDPWMAHQAPAYARLFEGHLVARDIAIAGHYSVVSLVANASPPQLAWISNDHYRGWLPLYVAGVLYYWTGQMFWSIMAVDLVAWWLGAVCMFRLAQRLGVSHTGSTVAALMCATSPAFTNSAWMSLLHLANTASLIWGTYAVLRILDGEFGGNRGLLSAGIALGLVLVGTSLLYNYVWVIVPSVLVVSIVEGPRRWRRGRLRTWITALVVFGVITFGIQRALGAAGWPLFVQSNDPSIKLRLLWDEVVRSPAPATTSLWLLSHLLHPGYMATVFHPLVLSVGLLGMALASWRLRLAGMVATVLALAQGALTALPWVVVNNYPFVYAGVGLVVARIYHTVACWRVHQTRLLVGPWLETAVAVAAVVVLVGMTNRDLLGDYQLVRESWPWLHIPI